jgi:hypothetical protein
MKSIKRFFRFSSCIGAAITFIGILGPTAHAAAILNIGGTCYTEEGSIHGGIGYGIVPCINTLDSIPQPVEDYVIEYAGTTADGTILYTITPA